MVHANRSKKDQKRLRCNPQNLNPPLDSVRRSQPQGVSTDVAGGGSFLSMPKRFTQTEKWLDPWFRDLPSEYRFLWIYLCDSCDMAGVWKKDLKAASFFIGCELSGEKALKLFNEEKERVLVINNSKYWVLKDFCLFQYGAFNPKSPIHLRVIGVLTGLGIDTLWGRVGPSLDPRQKEEEEEEEEEKEEEEVKEKEEVKEDRGKGGKKPYGEDGLVMLTAAEFEKLTTRLGETRTSEYVERLQN